MAKRSYLTAEGVELVFKDEYELLSGLNRGDEVLVEGMRIEYPYRLCYYATTLERDGEGDLYLYETGPDMNIHRLTRVVLCSDAIGLSK